MQQMRRPPARVLYGAGLRLRQLARNRSQIRAAAAALRRSVRQSRGGTELERRARERLALILCQEGLASDTAIDAMLASAGYTHRLASTVLRYPLARPAPALVGGAEDGASTAGRAHMAWRHLLRLPLPKVRMRQNNDYTFQAGKEVATCEVRRECIEIRCTLEWPINSTPSCIQSLVVGRGESTMHIRRVGRTDAHFAFTNLVPEKRTRETDSYSCGLTRRPAARPLRRRSPCAFI